MLYNNCRLPDLWTSQNQQSVVYIMMVKIAIRKLTLQTLYFDSLQQDHDVQTSFWKDTPFHSRFDGNKLLMFA